MKLKIMLRVAIGCIFSAALLLAGCGGGGGGGSGSTGPSVPTPVVSTVSGTASEGALILGKVVKLKDADGNSAPDATTNATTGVYSVDVTGLKAPYIVTVTSDSGTYVSLAPAVGTANINPITTAVVAMAAGTTDPKTLFTNLKAVDIATVAANYSSKAAALTTALDAALPTGVTAANFFTGTVVAGKGMDAMFDAYKITVDASNGITVATKDASATTLMQQTPQNISTTLPTITKPSMITLFVDASSAVAGQSITVTADVRIAGGAAPDNTNVTFSTDAGTLSATTAKTSGGRASVTITAPAAATATVSASANTVILKAPVQVTFAAAVQYSQAILKLKTTGTLPNGSKIGAWGVTIQYPASGLNIKTSSASTISLDKTVFYQSGVADASFSFTYSGTNNSADSTSTLPYLLLASLSDVSDATKGMSSIGEVATIVFDIVAGAAVPSKSSFVLSSKNIASTAAGGVKLTTVDLDFDLTLK